MQEFKVSDEPAVPSQASINNQDGRQIELRSVQRLFYKDGERVKSVGGVSLLSTQLVLEIDSADDIEVIPGGSDHATIRIKVAYGPHIRSIIADNRVKREIDVITLADMTEDLHPDLSHDLKDVLEQDFLRPLQSRAERLDSLLDEISTFASD